MCLPPRWVGFSTNCLPVGSIAEVWLERGANTTDPNQECPPRFTTERKASAMTIMIGIDPHKASHTAVAIDSNEHVLDELRVRSSAIQADRLRCWAAGFEQRTWAVESAQGLGYLLAQQLVAAGEVVLDVPAVRASRVRTLSSGRSQKNDPNDARSVAIAALRADDLAEVRADDHARILRLLVKRHRDLGRAKNQACCRLHALLLEMVPGGAGFRMVSVTRANTLIDSFEPINAMGRQRLEIARQLVAEIAHYDDRLKASKQRIQRAVAASNTSLTSICGLGAITAAMIIGHTGNIDRFPTKHRFGELQRDRPDRSIIGVQGSPSAEPARQPADELGDPGRRHFPAPTRHLGPRVLRPQDRRGQVVQRSNPRAEATTLRRHLPAPRQRRPPAALTIKWAREDKQERL